MTDHSVADLDAHRAVARLGKLFPQPWVISCRTMAGLTLFIARRPGLELMEATAQAHATADILGKLAIEVTEAAELLRRA
jgi:hypothetical protein